MDEIELLVAETFRHFHHHYGEGASVSSDTECLPDPALEQDQLPAQAGLLYHLQKSTSVFVVRSIVTKNIQEDFHKVLSSPEDYPSLRLLEGGADDLEKRLKFFPVDSEFQAEVIHDQIANRRYPIHEELVCNLSDPGFSWWLVKEPSGFTLTFNLASGEGTEVIKLGPLGDQQMIMANFQLLEKLTQDAGLSLYVQNELNKMQVHEGEDVLLEELRDLLEFGMVGEGMVKLFTLLFKRTQYPTQMETLWFYFQELAAIRRFWIQIQFDLGLTD